MAESSLARRALADMMGEKKEGPMEDTGGDPVASSGAILGKRLSSAIASGDGGKIHAAFKALYNDCAGGESYDEE
jgi:hypothetical protein